MRRAIICVVALATLYGVAAWAFVLPPLNPAPVFYENVPAEGQTYGCVDGSSIFIRFEDAGKTAVVRAGGQLLRLPYRTSSFMEDVYQSGSWRLMLDPEANLTGPHSIRYGSCY